MDLYTPDAPTAKGSRKVISAGAHPTREERVGGLTPPVTSHQRDNSNEQVMLPTSTSNNTEAQIAQAIADARQNPDDQKRVIRGHTGTCVVEANAKIRRSEA